MSELIGSKFFEEQDGTKPIVPLTGKVITAPYNELYEMECWLELSTRVCKGQGPYLSVCRRSANVGQVGKYPPTLPEAMMEAALRDIPLFLRCEYLDEDGYANTVYREVKIQ